ncbi:MAG: gamma-glutamyl-gamma-aminobutyrate hydrolase family protein [Chloroflexi bacterium]|nr:gamma-glutamyl-gamma-aminobutyrate hydrolase family protein [Chloroflexota bacterium]
MTHPLIGIPCRPDISSTYAGRSINAMSHTYINAIIQAGGLPVLIPLQVQGGLLHELFQHVDGLIFSGGGDIDPTCYGETPQVDNLDEVHPVQDDLELKLMQLATQERKPFLAICRLTKSGWSRHPG